MGKAFDGVRVIDFTQVFSGPYATSMLTLLGADVIKVEQPGTGDISRGLLDDGPLAAAGMSPVFQGMNAGKRAITLNLKHPDAAEVVERLVREADVVIENLRPGVMERLGVGYEAMKAIRPTWSIARSRATDRAVPRAVRRRMTGRCRRRRG